MSTYSVPPTASGDRAGSAGTTRALWVLIAVSTLLRLVWAGCLGAVVDEPYYIQYILHPDWSYFDHPPMVALVGMPGLALAGDAYSLLGLRVGFIVLFAGSTWLLARLTTGFYGPRAGLFAALALNVSGYFGMAVGTIAFPDGPLLFFWLLTLDRLAVALDDPRRLSPWVGMGIAWGGAMLSKYHAVLLPVGAVLYLILQPRARRCLRVPGSYLAVAIGLVMFAPVVYWNASHGWASLLFQGGRASASRGFRPEQLAVAIGAESLYLFPWLWIALVGILVQLVRRGWRRWDDGETFLVCQAVPALGLFHAVASFDRIMPYWPLFGFVSLLPLLGRSWVEWLDARPVLARRCLATVAVIPVLLAALICTQATFGLFGDSRGRLLGLIPPEGDPTVGLIGWDQLAADLEQRGLLGDPKTFLFTDSWHRSARLALAIRGKVPVACYELAPRSFNFWSRPEDWVGRDGIFVEADPRPGQRAHYSQFFRRYEALGPVRVVRRGAVVREFQLYRGTYQTWPFPFDGRLQAQAVARSGKEAASTLTR
jgi:4-amino-4-deoxy-L-arabinose transferase-like glycosyltransferase